MKPTEDCTDDCTDSSSAILGLCWSVTSLAGVWGRAGAGVVTGRWPCLERKGRYPSCMSPLGNWTAACKLIYFDLVLDEVHKFE